MQQRSWPMESRKESAVPESPAFEGNCSEEVSHMSDLL